MAFLGVLCLGNMVVGSCVPPYPGLTSRPSIPLATGSISSTSTSSVAPFVVPTSTSTLPIALAAFTGQTTASSTAPPFFVTNPANPQQSVAFGKATIQRSNLPDETDLFPLALVFAGSPFLVLLFSDALVYPLALAPWLTPPMYPSPAQLDVNNDKPQPEPKPNPDPKPDPNPDPDPKPSSVPKSSSSSTSSSSLPSFSSSSSGIIAPFTYTPLDGNFTDAAIIETIASIPIDSSVPISFATLSGGILQVILGLPDAVSSTIPPTTVPPTTVPPTTVPPTTVPPTTVPPTSVPLTSVPPPLPVGATTATSSCTTGPLPSFPTQFPPLISLNNQALTIPDLLYQMRQVVCGATCDQPPSGWDPSIIQVISGTDNEACALVVPIEGRYQAIVYRGTAFTSNSINGGTQQQECWDSTENAINCDSNPDHIGWTNGPASYQFYEAGIQLLNAKLPGTLSLSTQFATTQGLPRATPPMPSDTSGNNHGSSSCAIYRWHAPMAIGQYEDDYLYTGDIYISYQESDGAYNGMAAIYKCDTPIDKQRTVSSFVGMTGAQIKTAFALMKSKYHAKGCGSIYLSNGCQLTVNYCQECKHSWPPGQES